MNADDPVIPVAQEAARVPCSSTHSFVSWEWIHFLAAPLGWRPTAPLERVAKGRAEQMGQWSLPWRILVYSALYVCAALLGVLRGTPILFPQLVWLPYGISLVALIDCGYFVVPGLLISHVVFYSLSGDSIGLNFAVALVSMTQSCFAYWLLMRLGLEPSLRRTWDFVTLLIAGGLVPSVAFGALAFVPYHFLLPKLPVSDFWSFWESWIMRSTGGLIAITPFLLALRSFRYRVPARGFESILVVLLTAATALAAFSSYFALGVRIYPLSFLPFPFLVWAALRLRLLGVSLCTLIVAVCAVCGTATGRGPFAAADEYHAILLVWIYVCISTITTYLLFVGREERRALEELLIHVGEVERVRLGTELHDDLCQKLVGVEYLSKLLRDRAGLVSPEAYPYLDHISGEIRSTVQGMRNLARGHSPFGIGTQSLSVALADLAAVSMTLYAIDVRVIGDSFQSGLDQDAATHLFRIAQEAISNAVRHGASTAVEIELRLAGGRLSMTIRDNGSGLDTAGAGGSGLGFKTMSYRAGLLNGSLQVRNRANAEGVELVCRIPVNNGEREWS